MSIRDNGRFAEALGGSKEVPGAGEPHGARPCGPKLLNPLGRKGKRPILFTSIPLQIQKLCGVRTRETKRFPGFGGSCLKANSLPPTSDFWPPYKDIGSRGSEVQYSIKDMRHMPKCAVNPAITQRLHIQDIDCFPRTATHRLRS